MYSRVLGTGSALPKRIVTNGEFAAMLARDGIETSDEWIRTRTGIESRHFADEAEARRRRLWPWPPPAGRLRPRTSRLPKST